MRFKSNCFLIAALALFIAYSGMGLFAFDRSRDPGTLSSNTIRLDQRARAYLYEGNSSAAISLFQEALRANPYSAYSATLYFNLGRAYEMNLQPQLALASYQYASRIQPDFAPYYQAIVHVWESTGQLTNAKQQLQSICQSAPHDAYAWYLMGLVAKARKEPKQAEKAWRNFLAKTHSSALRQSVCLDLADCQL